jgi:hypothetical protein
MSEGGERSPAPLNHTRQATIDQLMEHFANDVLDVDEFERRVDRAHAATTSSELQEILSDLPGSGDLPAVRDDVTPAVSREFSVASPAHVKDSEFVVAVCGGSSRRGHWRPARKNYAVAVMGGTELDFREAVLPPGVTEVQVWTMWGGVEIIVPPGINVESRGIALLGGFDHAGTAPGVPDPSAPTIRVTGVAIMAGVEISVRHAGESSRDARRRRRLERREQRRRLRSGD